MHLQVGGLRRVERDRGCIAGNFAGVGRSCSSQFLSPRDRRVHSFLAHTFLGLWARKILAPKFLALKFLALKFLVHGLLVDQLLVCIRADIMPCERSWLV